MNNDKHVGLWVVRRIVPKDSSETAGRYYLAGRSFWHHALGFALRFGHRDDAVRWIAWELKRWPDKWGELAPVRLVKKATM